jgi:hypothetical protein
MFASFAFRRVDSRRVAGRQPAGRGVAIHRLAWAAWALAAIALTLLAGMPQALAQAPAHAVKIVNADVMLILGTQTDGGTYIDPLVGSLPQLGKPPFSAYNNYRLLDRKTIPLEQGKSANYTLVNTRVLQVSYMEQMPDGRFHVSAAINQPGGKSFLKLLEVKAARNEPFFVAGQAYKGGSLVLAITMRP